MSSSQTTNRPAASHGPTQESGGVGGQPPPLPPPPRSRVPLGVKNVLGAQHSSGGGGSIKPDDSSSYKHSPTYHHSRATPVAPPPATARISSLVSTSIASNAASAGAKHSSYHPSPLSAAHRSPFVAATAAPAAAVVVKEENTVSTPKKRRVPLEDVHCRNVVQEDKDEVVESPKKRSRSSNEGNSSAEEPHTSTSLGISQGISDLQVQAPPAKSSTQRSVPPPSVTHLPLNTDRERESKSRQPTSRVTAQLSQHLSQQHMRQTTVRIDKQSRITEAERSHLERQKRERTAEWRRKFIKAFPSFRFYLDGFDDTTRQEVMRCIEMLDGTIEPFFSNKVTHLVTTRKIPIGTLPSEPSKSSTASASAATTIPHSSKVSRASNVISRSTAKQITVAQTTTTAAAATQASTYTASTKSISASRLPSLRRKNISVPLHSDRNPFEECGPPVSSNDILVKAKNFNIKVWTQDKFRQIISGLLGDELDSTALKRLDLSQMLEKEKLQGTLDRDPTAARPDYHYFAKNAIFLMVEDATAEHRPIMIQEFPRPVSEDHESPWPVLYGQLEGRCPFTRFDLDKDYQRKMRPNRHETLRRSVSLNHLYSNRGDRTSVSPAPSGDGRAYSVHRGASPYPMASGNSVSITSNIASTTSTAVGGPPMTYGKQVAQMGRKMYQPTGIGLGRPSSSSVAQSPRSPVSFADAARGGDNAGGLLSAEQARGTLVRRMLGMSEHQNRLSGIRRSVSTASAGRELRREKRPGYCENCRTKYDDFDEHVTARRHRRFALDDANFVGIDELLGRVRRPLAPWAESVIAAEEEASSGHAEDDASLSLSSGTHDNEAAAVREEEERIMLGWQSVLAPHLDPKPPSPTTVQLHHLDEARWAGYSGGNDLHRCLQAQDQQQQEFQSAGVPYSAATEYLSSTATPAVSEGGTVGGVALTTATTMADSPSGDDLDEDEEEEPLPQGQDPITYHFQEEEKGDDRHQALDSAPSNYGRAF